MPFSVRLLYKSVITKPPSFNEITMFANTYVFPPPVSEEYKSFLCNILKKFTGKKNLLF